MSFVKLSAERRGHAPSRESSDTAPPTAGSCVGPVPSPSQLDEERKSRQATDCSSSDSSSDSRRCCAGRSEEAAQPPPAFDRKMSSCARERGGGAPCVASLSRRSSRVSSRRFLIGGGEAGAPATTEDKGGTTGDAGGVLYSDESCSVCLDEYEEGDQLLQLTCGHVFHRHCIDYWLNGHCVCPCCRCVRGGWGGGQ